MKFLKWFLLTLAIMLIWLSLNVISTKQGWFTTAIAPTGDNNAFISTMKASINSKSNGNVAMLVINNGKIVDEHYISKGEPVNNNTVFGVSSLSKWVTAVGIMVLVEQGKLDLDKPVSSYITQWQLPSSDFDNNGVTIRRLLSHTAGITDGLGHNGFDTREQVQPLVEHLTKALDAEEDVNGSVNVGIEPGSKFKYSGGSYNLLQLVVEEVTGLSFESYMFEAVFTPLGMTSTTYRHDNVENLAQYFDLNGDIRKYPYYTSLAATGLYTTTSDLHKFVNFHLNQNLRNANTTDILSNQSLKVMRTPHASMMGIDVWGLGAMLFTTNNRDDYIIGHGGKSPSLNATVRLNPANGNAFILLETGNSYLGANSATQWTLWETGNPDMYMLKNMIPAMIKRVLIGCILILIASLIIVWRKRSNDLS